jgi:hypothetical protein
MSDLITCANPNCKKEYIVEDKRTDDGYCSQECWETKHCSAPIEPVDVLDITTESLLKV